MSVECEIEGYLCLKDGTEAAKTILDDPKYRKSEYTWTVNIHTQTSDEISFSILGHRCEDCWERLKPKLKALCPKAWLFMFFEDMDFCYHIDGNLGKGNFTKKLYLSKARVQFEEIQDSTNPARTTIEKINNNKLKVKYI